MVFLLKVVPNTGLAAFPIPFNLIPFAKPDGTMNGTFDDMLKVASSQASFYFINSYKLFLSTVSKC